jgi:lanthanide-dependent methanol dehydrogenase
MVHDQSGNPATQSVPGEWRMPAKDYASTRFSELAEIHTGNVHQLTMAFTFDTGERDGHEASPLIINNHMYIVTPYPNILYCLELSADPSVGYRMKWKYEPQPSRASQGVACCGVVNRGATYWEGKIIYNTLDCHTVAVDADSGEEVWKTKLGEFNRGETMTMAPLIVKGVVLVGNSGGELGVRGWLKGLDANNGRLLWTAYSTGSDEDCLIGENFRPYYAMDQGTDLGLHSWPPEKWQLGGGTVWGWISYDPELDLIYYGTGNPGVWNPDLRPGDNKWTCGLFARRPETGEAVWHYQWTPHDEFDHDSVNEQILLDLPVDGPGQPLRKVLVRVERNGYIYVLDRQTGQVLSATPFVRITSSLGVDLETGRLVPNPAKKPELGKVIRDITPAAPGAKDWQPAAFSPQTGLLYVPHQHLAMDFETLEANYIAGTPYLGVNVKMYADPAEPDGNRGEFMAWDILQKQKVWSIKERFPVWCGALVTAGDVVFYGNMEGMFKAVHATTGELLWQFKTGSGIIAPPVTYTGPDGHQYVAVMSGVGGWAGAVVSGNLDPNDPTAALGFVGAMQDLPDHTARGGSLYVFRLP